MKKYIQIISIFLLFFSCTYKNDTLSIGNNYNSTPNSLPFNIISSDIRYVQTKNHDILVAKFTNLSRYDFQSMYFYLHNRSVIFTKCKIKIIAWGNNKTIKWKYNDKQEIIFAQGKKKTDSFNNKINQLVIIIYLPKILKDQITNNMMVAKFFTKNTKHNKHDYVLKVMSIKTK